MMSTLLKLGLSGYDVKPRLVSHRGRQYMSVQYDLQHAFDIIRTIPKVP